MQLIYDDMIEFAEISKRCYDNAISDKCKYCIFSDRCQSDSIETRHIFCGTIIDHGSVKGISDQTRIAESNKSKSDIATEWQKMG